MLYCRFYGGIDIRLLGWLHMRGYFPKEVIENTDGFFREGNLRAKGIEKHSFLR